MRVSPSEIICTGDHDCTEFTCLASRKFILDDNSVIQFKEKELACTSQIVTAYKWELLLFYISEE